MTALRVTLLAGGVGGAKMAEGFVQDDQTSMIVVSEAYDPDIPAMENDEYLKKVREIMKIQEDMLAEGAGFGELGKRLKGRGMDPDEIIARFRREAAENTDQA